MVAALTEVLADTLGVSVLVNGQAIEISSLVYTARVDKARKVDFNVEGSEQVQHCRIGNKVAIKTGRERGINNLSFDGIIKRVQPTNTGATVTVMDYITFLATSTYVNYKLSEIVGQDLYFLAASAMDIADIDTTYLTQGSGVRATQAMGLEGLQTRKEFIEKCFDNMYYLVEDTTSYYHKINVVYFHYAIHMDNRMDIMRIDDTNIHVKPALSVSMRDNSITSIRGELDTTRLTNSLTVESSVNTDISFTYKDANSIAKYGVNSDLISVGTDNFPIIVNTTKDYVDRNSDPSFNFSLTLRNADHLALGDLVEVSHPLIERAIKLPITRYVVTASDGLISNITLGRRRLSLGETIAKTV